jgi:hypothetical protein
MLGGGFANKANLGFSKLLMVEGPTDVKVFQQLLNKLRIDREVTILSLGGSAGISRNADELLSEIKNITTNVFALA